MARRTALPLALILAAAGCNKQQDDAPPSGEASLAPKVAEKIQAQVPGVTLSIVDPYTIKLKTADDLEAEISLDNLRAQCAAAPDECDAATDAFVGGLTESIGQMGEEEEVTREQIRAVLKNDDYMAEIDRARLEAPADMREDNEVMRRKLVGDLWIMYVVDQKRSMRGVTRATLEQLALDEAALHELAMANMQSAFDGPLPHEPIEGAENIHILERGDSYEAARLLLHDKWKPLHDELPGGLVVAIPTRDAVLMTGADSAESIELLRRVASQAYAEEAYPLTESLLKWTESGWAPY